MPEQMEHPAAPPEKSREAGAGNGAGNGSAALDEMPVIPAVGHSTAVEDGVVLDRSSLTLVQRLLLTTDGTITHVLEAYAGEPVQVVKIAQSFAPAAAHDVRLQALPGDPVLWRKVLLRGSDTRRPFIYAESALLLDRLDPAICDALFLSELPIGKLLFDHRVETLRELIVSGREQAGPVGFYLGIGPSEPLLFRTYRIVHGGLTLMVITEKFAETAFR